jgi:hypothetical protein
MAIEVSIQAVSPELILSLVTVHGAVGIAGQASAGATAGVASVAAAGAAAGAEEGASSANAAVLDSSSGVTASNR